MLSNYLIHTLLQKVFLKILKVLQNAKEIKRGENHAYFMIYTQAATPMMAPITTTAAAITAMTQTGNGGAGVVC